MENNHNRESTTRSKKSGGCGGTFLYLIMILGVSVILSMILLFSANDIFAFVKENRTVTLTVENPITISALSRELDRKGVIHYSSLFHVFVKVTGKDDEVKSGDYELNPSMDYGAIVRSLKGAGNKSTVTITIPEGYTLKQIREALLNKNVCDENSLDEALTTYAFKHDFLKGMLPAENWLEGYLFPDTYEFYTGDNAVQVVNKMLNNFASKYDQTITDGAQKLGMSLHDVTTIASLVEREAQHEDEFAKIAGVIHNRLNHSANYPYLQIDATLQYAVGHKDVLTEADKQVNSPYNTYINKGLPPGPIASPGYTALYAASHPETHAYYYYVAMPDGSHLFAKTLSAHNKNVQVAKKAFAEAKKS